MLQRCWLAVVVLSLCLSFPISAKKVTRIQTGGFQVLVPLNDAPVAVDDAFTVDEDSREVLNVLANDQDEVLSTISVTLHQTTTHGTLTETSTGQFRYQPADNFHGTDSFTYSLTDEKGRTSDVVTAAITVSAVNDAPDGAGRQRAPGGRCRTHHPLGVAE